MESTRLPALALALWLAHRHRRGLLIALHRLLNGGALLGLRISTALALLLHRVAATVHHILRYVRSAVARSMHRPVEVPGAQGLAAPRSVITPNAIVNDVAQCTPALPPPPAALRGAQVAPPVAPTQDPVPVVLAACPQCPVCPAAVSPRGAGAWAPPARVPPPLTALAHADGEPADAPLLSFSFQGCAWMMHCACVIRRPLSIFSTGMGILHPPVMPPSPTRELSRPLLLQTCISVHVLMRLIVWPCMGMGVGVGAARPLLRGGQITMVCLGSCTKRWGRTGCGGATSSDPPAGA